MQGDADDAGMCQLSNIVTKLSELSLKFGHDWDDDGLVQDSSAAIRWQQTPHHEHDLERVIERESVRRISSSSEVMVLTWRGSNRR